MPLNDSRCKNAKPKHKPYKLGDMDGLYLFIQTNGKKYWRFKYRYFQSEKTLSLGEYPKLGLQQARNLKDAARKDLQDGNDPCFLKSEKKRLRHFNDTQSFETVSLEWYEIQKSSWSLRHAGIVKRRIQFLINEIGSYPFDRLTVQTLFTCLKKAEEQSPELAKRLLQFLTRICRHAHRTGRVEKDLTFGLQDSLKKVKYGNYACLDMEDVPDFVSKLYQPVTSDDLLKNYATKLLMHLLTRTVELLHAERIEFNLEKALWTIPESRMKMARSHIVPLSEQVIKMLLEMDKLYGENRKYLFPSPVKRNKPICKNIVLSELERIYYKSSMTGHGFRAMGITIGTEILGYEYDVIDRQLAHAPKGEVRRAYDRAKFLKKRTAFMQAYSDYLDSFNNPQPAKGNNDRYQFQKQCSNYSTVKYSTGFNLPEQYQLGNPQQGHQIRTLSPSSKEWTTQCMDGSGNPRMY